MTLVTSTVTSVDKVEQNLGDPGQPNKQMVPVIQAVDDYSRYLIGEVMAGNDYVSFDAFLDAAHKPATEPPKPVEEPTQGPPA